MLTIKKLPENLVTTLLAALVILVSACTPAGPKALLEGERLIKKGRWDAAVEQLRLATDLLPYDARAWNFLGLAHHGKGESREAARCYRQALDLDRDLAEARYNLGCLFLEQRDYGAAEIELKTYQMLVPGREAAMVKLGAAQLGMGDYQNAYASFEEALRRRPDQPEAWNGLGVIQARRARYRDAHNYFERAIEYQSDYSPALLNQAVVNHQYLSDSPTALNKYRRFMFSKPDSPLIPAVRTLAQQIEDAQKLPEVDPYRDPNSVLANVTAPTKEPAETSIEPRKNYPEEAPEQVSETVLKTAESEADSSLVQELLGPTSDDSVMDVEEVDSRALSSTTGGTGEDSDSELGDVSGSVHAEVESTAESPERTDGAPIVESEPVASISEASTDDSASAEPELEVVYSDGSVDVEASEQAASGITADPLEVVELTFEPPFRPAMAPPFFPPPNLGNIDNTAIPPTVSGLEGAAASVTAEASVTSASEYQAIEVPASAFVAERPPTAITIPEPSPPLIAGTAEESGRPTPPPDREVVELDAEERESRLAFLNRLDPRRWRTPGWLRFRGRDREDSFDLTNDQTSQERIDPADSLAAGAFRENLQESELNVVRRNSGPIARYRYVSPLPPNSGDRQSAQSWFQAGNRHFREGGFQAAVDAYREAIRHDGGYFEAYYNLGLAGFQAGQMHIALSAYEFALALEPRHRDSRYNFALALEASGYYEDAVNEWSEIIAKNPDDAQTLLALGNLHAHRLGQSLTAKDYFSRFLAIAPDHPKSTSIRYWMNANP